MVFSSIHAYGTNYSSKKYPAEYFAGREGGGENDDNNTNLPVPQQPHNIHLEIVNFS